MHVLCAVPEASHAYFFYLVDADVDQVEDDSKPGRVVVLCSHTLSFYEKVWLRQTSRVASRCTHGVNVYTCKADDLLYIQHVHLKMLVAQFLPLCTLPEMRACIH